MQLRMKFVMTRLFFVLGLCFVSNVVFAERGVNQTEVLIGANIDNELPLSFQVGYLMGFNDLTDLAFHLAADYAESDSVFEIGVGSYYTQRIGDINPQFGFSVGPRIHVIDGDKSKGLFLKAHFRTVFEVDTKLHLIGEYSPGIEFGDNDNAIHQIKVGIRF